MYRKQLFTFSGARPVPTVIRRYEEADFDDLIRIQRESFPPPTSEKQWWRKDQLRSQIAMFPEGALIAEVDGETAGSMTGFRIDLGPGNPEHTWHSITDNGYIRNHKADGNTLYIVDICVRPAYRRLKIGYWLIQSMYELAVALGIPRVVGGGRMPGYHLYADKLSPDDYVRQVIHGQITDPVLTFLMKAGRTPLKVLPNYLRGDRDSCFYAVLTEWRNPFADCGVCPPAADE
ncbi:GNAT family N-acetyltransferase [Gordoniibacillus kamchatkensis]|uniref:GNAT family N-acetyltransferase n=1 Tax=Gordoniibacillus kamchatkensis TaxID=1590651 RepID=UPI000698907F|nr:GNAT family N-acetyltransferase [Paenibacillus sp. VKM B-2647]